MPIQGMPAKTLRIMTKIPTEVEVYSDDGQPDAPNYLKLKMNGSKPDCPITLYNHKNKAVFSLACHEVDDFCEALQEIAP